MVVNFRARGISRGARKLARTPTIIKKIIIIIIIIIFFIFSTHIIPDDPDPGG